MDLSWLDWSATAVVAHVLYGLSPSGSVAVRRVALHNGDDFTPADGPPRPDRLVGVRVVTAHTTVPLVPAGEVATGVHVDVPAHIASPAWVVVETPPAFIELAGPKFTKYLTHEGLSPVLAARDADGTADAVGREIYSKHTKTAIGDADSPLALLTGAVGSPVEFVPMSPAPAVGEELAMTLLVDGAPAPDWQVLVHHRRDDEAQARQVACLRTDAAGRVTVRLDAEGHWRWHAVVMAAHADAAEADWRSRWACLAFRL